ncbi:hypothetical protein ACE1MK_15500 [Tenacibaculum maritimum]|uniref:hypothetical protein n=1 Tax=Tenacibaculum maritimum TaxID=107401 RepID=UPI00132FDC74|nr:hypothetical protein [Tenacibaculum maritimum]MCD9581801.1 hypothetical protein [Tenacibaculum maritimum]
MKIFFKLLTIVWCIGCIACTDTTEKTIAQLYEKQELFGVNKSDIKNPGGGGESDPDDTED